MEDFQVILSFIITVLGLLGTLLTFSVKLCKTNNEKRTAEQILEIIDAIVPELIIAEQLPGCSGKEKKAYVLNRIEQFAQGHNIQFNTEFVDKKIEEFMRLTKQVNKLIA